MNDYATKLANFNAALDKIQPGLGTADYLPSLYYVDYLDHLTDDQIDQYLAGDESFIYEIFDNSYLGETLDQYLAELGIDRYDEISDEVCELFYEYDDSDPIRDLVRNTPAQFITTRLAVLPDNQTIAEAVRELGFEVEGDEMDEYGYDPEAPISNADEVLILALDYRDPTEVGSGRATKITDPMLLVWINRSYGFEFQATGSTEIPAGAWSRDESDLDLDNCFGFHYPALRSGSIEITDTDTI